MGSAVGLERGGGGGWRKWVGELIEFLPESFQVTLLPSRQCAAKVAFFKLKLDQLMESRCLVCRAESKQNLRKETQNVVVIVVIFSVSSTPASDHPTPSNKSRPTYLKAHQATILGIIYQLCSHFSIKRLISPAYTLGHEPRNFRPGS